MASCIFSNVQAQEIKGLEKSFLKQLDSMAVYMLCKGTKSKIPIVARQFNYADTNSTHVGIGFIQNAKLIIYNMVNIFNEVALKEDSLNSFLKDDNICYFSIWKTSVTKEELGRMEKFIIKIARSKPKFDSMFDLNNGERLLYCSEFCRLALRKMNAEKYSFQPRKMQLDNELYENILQRKTLKYIPVDFFQQSPYFKKIYELYFEIKKN